MTETATFAKKRVETKTVEMVVESGKANDFFVNLTPYIMAAEKKVAIMATTKKVMLRVALQ